MNRQKQKGYPQKKKNLSLGEHRYFVRICSSIPKVKTLCAKTFSSFQTVDWKGLGLDMATIHGDSIGKKLWIDAGLTPKKSCQTLICKKR